MSRPPSTFIGEVRKRDPEEARVIVLRTLHECHGFPGAAARALDISRPHLHFLIRKFGLRGVPQKIREEVRARFRLRAA